MWIYFSEKPLWNFWVCQFTCRNSRENKLSRLEIPRCCVTSLGNSKVKNQDSWKFHISFSWTSLIDAWNFQMLFLQYPWKFPVLNPPRSDFFWNSLFEVVFISKFTFAVFWYYDTLLLTSVSIVLHKIGLTIHWFRLVHRKSYKM